MIAFSCISYISDISATGVQKGALAMKKKEMRSFADMFYGVATVGERGQVVIPAAIRRRCKIGKGDRLLVFEHPFKTGFMMFPVGEMESLMKEMMEGLAQIKEQLNRAEQKE